MSCRIDFVAKSLSGYGLPDGKYFPCYGLSTRVVIVSPCSSRGNCKKFPQVNILQPGSTTRSTSFVCNASYSNQRANPDFSKNNNKHGNSRSWIRQNEDRDGYDNPEEFEMSSFKNGQASYSYQRTNPEFSKNNKHGNSRSWNRQNEDRDGYENSEEFEMFSSKNGPLPSKVQATATPGPTEKQIVQLFRKVQAQLRERAAAKEDNVKVEEIIEESKGIKGKERESVDLLLNALKRSVQKEKKTSNSTDFILNQSSPTDVFSNERSTKSRSTLKHEEQENEDPVMIRPKSVFQRRSPVSRIKFQPSYSEEDNVNPVAPVDTELESVTKPIFSDEDVFDDELSEDEGIDMHHDDDDDDDEEEDKQVGASKLDEMKITELRALAKSRGLKGYSKLKKVELIELLGQI